MPHGSVTCGTVCCRIWGALQLVHWCRSVVCAALPCPPSAQPPASSCPWGQPTHHATWAASWPCLWRAVLCTCPHPACVCAYTYIHVCQHAQRLDLVYETQCNVIACLLHAYVCSCMYAGVCVCQCVCICISVWKYGCTCQQMYACTCIRINKYSVHVWVYIFLLICTCTQIWIDIQINLSDAAKSDALFLPAVCIDFWAGIHYSYTYTCLH